MPYARIALAAALSLALGACDREADRPASAPRAAAPMSMVETDARIASIVDQTTDCNLEFANGVGFEPEVPSLSGSAPIVVDGWLIDAKAGAVPKPARIRLETPDGSQAWEQPITKWLDRADVVSSRGGNAALQKSGFNVTLKVGALEAGRYQVYLSYDTPDGDVSCAVGRQLTLS